MENKVKFEIDEINNFIEDEDPEFALAEIKFLSTARNSHGIKVTEDILRRDASTVLGKPLVGKMNNCFNDCQGHEEDEIIFGWFPLNQEVQFEKRGNIVIAKANAVVSKLYATSFYNIFTKTNKRNVSVEMLLDNPVEQANHSIIIDGLHITGVTALGKSINGSCPDATMSITRFSKKAEAYYTSIWEKYKMSEMEKFVKNRKVKMESKSYSVNTTELKDTPWGDVDKIEMRNKIMEASNRSELVKKVYLQVLNGWEDSPSENLKYPVMELDGNTFYYNRGALASALAYAKQHDESEVVSKVMKLYDKFNIGEEGEEENMSKEKFGDETWAEIAEEVKEHEGENATVESVEADHIVFIVDDVRYRVDADIEMDDEEKILDANIHWDTKAEMESEEESTSEVKEAETEEEPESEVEETKEEESTLEEDAVEDEPAEDNMAEDENDDEPSDNDKEDKDDEEEIIESSDEVEQLKAIIAEKDEELEELRAYKEEKECAERDAEVMMTLEEIKSDVDTETFESLKTQGMECKLAEIDGWKNMAKALAYQNSKSKKVDTSVWSMSIPKKEVKKTTKLWGNMN